MAKLQLTIEPGKQEIRGTRIFNAPPATVFKAYIEAAALEQWWGPSRYSTIVELLEARPGGRWRFINRGDQGQEFAFHGVFHEVSFPHRLVSTFEYEGEPGHVLLETITFEEFEGKTRLSDHLVFQSVADRDGMVSAGMESGSTESMDRLEAWLQKMAVTS